MSTDYSAWARQVRHFHTALHALQPTAAALKAPPLAGQEWYELLVHKLLPQLDTPPVLVVAVVGGTNIGKSVIFNHLAGEVASAVSPLAAGTKHPVCLTPANLADPELLQSLFAGFQLRAWQTSQDSLADTSEHLLFWRVGQNVPERLLLLDTPDIDSDAVVNWQRADQVRQSADVLVAVLTQQKYNDAAVKQFFLKAAAADKQVIVVFNQCDLTADRDYWPQWLATFTSETGVEPELVYVVPHDRQAASELRLSFYEVGADGRRPHGEPSSLRTELAALHFDAIKIRTFRGAMQSVLDPQRGAPGWFRQVRAASGEFSAAMQAIAAMKTRPVEWPSLPARVLVDEIRAWWDSHRSNWSRSINDVYRTIGQGVTWPVRKAWEAINPPGPDRLDLFHTEERRAIVRSVEHLFNELDRLAEVGNETLRPRLMKLLSGDARGDLLRRVQAAHDELPPIDEDYRTFVRKELDAWSQANPRAVSMLRSLDHVLALARPAITVSLAASGWIVAGGLVHDAAVQVVGHTAGQLATEAVITGGITGGGEVLVSTTGEGVKQAAARLFSRLQTRYAELRAAWLANWLERELLGDTLTELRHGAEVPQSPAFQQAEKALAAIEMGS
jgi:hypothetical protein